MTILNLDFDTNEDGYSDGSIEYTLAELLKSGKDPEEILAHDTSWETVYHLSPQRENILSWFPFKKDCCILEVGSGCGALTSLLSKRAKKVVSVELTRSRAQVNYERNKNLDNVEIIVGNFNNIHFDEKFDYIILNGVLEYAGSFTQDIHPYVHFLDNLKKLLKKDGCILIAIENRLGHKYLNGAPEDHTNQLFSGINNYTRVNNVRTFTKSELSEILKSAGLDYVKFYYPYPDYKFPNLILTDESLSMMDVNQSGNNYNSNRLQFFSDISFINSLKEEKILDSFMNSFLVVASPDPIPENSLKYVKFPVNRDKKFSLITYILNDKENKKVIKQAQYPEALEHIKKIFKTFTDSEAEDYQLIPAELNEDILSFDFIEGGTFERYLLDLMQEREFDTFTKEINNFQNNLFKDSELDTDRYTLEFEEFFGKEKVNSELHWKDKSNMDLLFSNIMNDENKRIIDYEWIVDFPIPQEFILFRSLYYFYLANQEVKELVTLDELLSIVELDGKKLFTPEMIDIFIKWDSHFGNIFVKGNYKGIEPQTTYNISSQLDSINSQINGVSTLFLDTGKGFSENEKISSRLQVHGDDLKIVFDLSDLRSKNEFKIKNLRWDPIETGIELKDLKVISDNGELSYKIEEPYSSKIFQDGSNLVFLDNDPYLYLYGDIEDINKIIITGKIKQLDYQNLFGLLEKLYSLNQEKDQQINNLKRNLKSQKFSTKYLQEETSDNIKKERGFSLTE